MKRRLIALLILALLTSGALAEAKVLTLPPATKVIEAEAFAGVKGAKSAVLPEGILEIRAGAFRDSGIRTLNLPDTLVLIDEDAFEGSTIVYVTATEGSYAYQWADERGYIKRGLTIAGLNVAAENGYITTQTQTWSPEVINGTPPYTYAYTLKRGTTTLATRAYSTESSYSYTFLLSGDYELTVSIKDKDGDTAAVTYPFTVTLGGTKLTGVVRIYVDTDAKGNIVQKSSKTGHYELQIQNDSGASLSYDNHVFDSPVFSYGSTNGGDLKLFDADGVNRSNAQLWTFSFETTAEQVDELLRVTMDEWVADADSEKTISIGYQYESLPYIISTRNCFIAVAAWCKVLGYSTLDNIVNTAADYSDYIAWRMFERYGSYWTYVGQY